VDYVNDPRSSILDALSIVVIDGTQVKIYAWYDKEWGYVNRTMGIARMIAKNALIVDWKDLAIVLGTVLVVYIAIGAWILSR